MWVYGQGNLGLFADQFLSILLVASSISFAGIELIFFIVACMVLCFGFVKTTVLITMDVSAIAEQCLHSVKAFSLFPTSEQDMGAQEAVRGHNQDS